MAGASGLYVFIKLYAADVAFMTPVNMKSRTSCWLEQGYLPFTEFEPLNTLE